jgi:hypothetical protein
MAGEPLPGRPRRLLRSNPCPFLQGIGAFLQGIGAGLYEKDAAATAGLAVSTLERHNAIAREARERGGRLSAGERRAVEFLEALEKARANFRLGLHGIIIREAKAGDWKAAMTLLERLWLHEYGRRFLHVEGEIAVQVDVTHRAEELLEQVRSLREQQEAASRPLTLIPAPGSPARN